MAYLCLRAAEARPEIWAEVFSASTAELLLATLGLSAAVSLSVVVLAVPLSWLLVRSDLPGRGLFRVLTPLPLAIPSYLGALTWVALFAPGGLMQGMLHLPAYGFVGAYLVLTLLTYPYALLPTIAALENLDPAQEEAARTLGRGPWAARWAVTLPALRPALRSGGLLVLLYVLSDFGAVSLLRFDTFTTVLYVQFESTIDRSGTAALALVFVGVAGALLAGGALWSWWRPAPPEVRKQRVRAAPAAPLGRLRIPATLFVGALVSLSVLLPFLVMLWWLLGAAHGVDVARLAHQAWSSLSVSIASAAFATLAALPIAVWVSRGGGRVAYLVAKVAHTSYSLPGMVVALGLVFVGVRYLPWAYQTWGLLVAAYVVRFVPQAYAAQSAVLARIRPSMLEAARSLGRGPLRAFLEVVVPLARPGLFSGALLVFLTTMKELPLTLLLSPLDFTTLATTVWSHASEADFGQAAGGALLLLSVSTAPLLVRQLQEVAR